MKHCLSLIMVLALTMSILGCELKSQSKISLSQLTGNAKQTESNLKVELGDCENEQDKSKPSDDLLQANDAMKNLFGEYKFMQCKDTYAYYKVPVTVGEFEANTVNANGIPMLLFDGNKVKIKGISILKNKKDNNVYFVLSNKLQKAMDENDFDLNAYVEVKNDLKENVIIYPNSVYINNEPFTGPFGWKLNKIILPDETLEMQLSDISTKFAQKTGSVIVFSMPKNK